MPPLASIDLGTHTCRLLIADSTPAGSLSTVLTKRVITRLGEGFARRGLMQPLAMNRTMAALEDFTQIIDAHQVEKVSSVATSVVREAENGAGFIEQVYKQTGLSVRILTGSEEARLTLKGVLSAVVQPPANTLVFDIGGGSTEFILSEDTPSHKLQSTALGVLFLAETLPLSDPPSARELSRLRTAIRKHLSLIDFSPAFPAGTSPPSLIGTAGTVTTLAAIDQKMEHYDPRTINNYRLSREALTATYENLISLTALQRTAIPGLEKGREGVIIQGTAIVLEIMSRLGCNHLTVSDAGLLEGILLDGMDFH